MINRKTKGVLMDIKKKNIISRSATRMLIDSYPYPTDDVSRVLCIV